MEGSVGRAETQPTVLVAIEPRVYRETIAKALQTFRPSLSTKAVEQSMLDAELSRTSPMLVLCNGAVETSVESVPNRVIFRGDESDSSATVEIDGRQSEMESLDLDYLLRIVDRAVSSTQAGRTSPIE